MRKLSLILAAALLLALPLGVDARKGHPHALLAIDSITVADATFPGSAPISYTLATVLGPTELPLALGVCQGDIDGGGWAEYASLAGGVGSFRLDYTPSWQAVQSGSCTATLLDWDWYNGTFTPLASTTFTVTP